MVDRLRSLGPARLARAVGVGGSPADKSPAHASPADKSPADASPADKSAADLAHALAQRVADLMVAGSVPRLADHAAGDQLAVLVADLLAQGDEGSLRVALTDLVGLRRAL